VSNIESKSVTWLRKKVRETHRRTKERTRILVLSAFSGELAKMPGQVGQVGRTLRTQGLLRSNFDVQGVRKVGRELGDTGAGSFTRRQG